MIGVGRLREVLQVTSGAIHRGSGESPVDMAGRAQDADVRAGQAELGRVVVESRTLPGIRVVAPAAVVRKACGYVIGAGRGRKCLRVAAVAVC